MGKGYYYFETPDYADCEKKLFCGVKYAGAVTAVYATQEIIFRPEPKTMRFVSGRYFMLCAPLVGAVALGSSVACTLSNLRGQKDDNYNYFWGGMASGLVWALRFNASTGLFMGCLSAAAASLVKHGHKVENDWVMMPTGSPNHANRYGSWGGRDLGDFRTKAWSYEDPGRRPM
jgi:hypothetical protein